MKKIITFLISSLILMSSNIVNAADKIVFGTNWLAQGGHGGFYQAIADGTYKKHGLDVEIMMGGPQMNNRPMLIAGKLDFLMTGNLLLSFDNIRNGIPTMVVGAFFQKDPQAIISHSGKYNNFSDLKNAPTVLVSKDGQFSFWKWMVNAHGFKDEQVKPYAYNLAQFLQDEKMVQQAYGTAEPIYAAAAGAKPETFLLADHGWTTYSTTIETRTEMVQNNPDLIQRFMNASIEGWYNFLYGDRSAAYGLIMEDNPEMTKEKLDKEMAQFEKLGIIDVGDALTKGIGAMDMARVKSFHKLAIDSGIIEAGSVDINKVATDQFVNKGHGLDIKDKLK